VRKGIAEDKGQLWQRYQSRFHIDDAVAKALIPMWPFSLSRFFIQQIPQFVRGEDGLIPSAADGSNDAGGEAAGCGCTGAGDVGRTGVANKRLAQISQGCIADFAEVTGGAQVRLPSGEARLSRSLRRTAHPYSVGPDGSGRQHSRMGIGAVDAVAGS